MYGIEVNDWEKMKPMLARANLAFYANEFLTGPPEPPFSGKFMTVDHHIQWADLVNDHRLLCINAARGHGKSACAGTLVLRADGVRVPIEQWEGGDVLAFDVAKNEYVPAYAPKPEASEPVPCLRIRTRTGREIDVTAEHPFLTFGGWTEARSLALRQRIALPRRVRVESDTHNEDAWLLGALIGNGSMLHSYVQMSTGDPAIRDEIISLAAARNWSTREHKYSIYLHANYSRSGPLELTRRYGIYGHNSHVKRVPAVVFTSSEWTICEFIAGLVDTDCHVDMTDC